MSIRKRKRLNFVLNYNKKEERHLLVFAIMNSQTIEYHEFELIAVGRALLQDPEWFNKVKEERLGDVDYFARKSLTKLYGVCQLYNESITSAYFS